MDQCHSSYSNETEKSATTPLNSRGRSKELFENGLECLDREKYNDALQYFRDSLQISREISGDSDSRCKDVRMYEMDLLWNIGISHNEIGQYDDAKDIFGDALKISRELGDRKQEMHLLDWLGSVCEGLAQYNAALKHYQAASVLSRTIRGSDGSRDMCVHKEDDMSRLVSIGEIHCRNGQYCNEKDSYEDALEISRELGDRKEEMCLLDWLGSVCEELELYGAALEHYQAASDMSHETGDQVEEMRLAFSLGFVFTNLGQYCKAIEMLQAALEISHKICK